MKAGEATSLRQGRGPAPHLAPPLPGSAPRLATADTPGQCTKEEGRDLPCGCGASAQKRG